MWTLTDRARTAFRLPALLCLLIAALLALSSCRFFIPPIPTDNTDKTEDNTEAHTFVPDPGSGRYKWPAAQLPRNFPVLEDEIDAVFYNDKGQLAIYSSSVGWAQAKAYIDTLIAAGWGSIADGIARIYRENSTEDTQLSDEALLRASLKAMAEYYSYTDENTKTVTYCGACGSDRLMISFHEAASDAQYRFNMWVYGQDAPEVKTFSDPDCTVSLESGWTASVRDGQLYVTYDHDLSGTCEWSLSGGPAAGMTAKGACEAYIDQLRTVLSGELPAPVVKDENHVNFSFVTQGTVADIVVTYCAFVDSFGVLWELTTSANVYDQPMMERVSRGVLAQLERCVPA